MKKSNNLINDGNFENGFEVMGINPAVEQRTIVKILNFKNDHKPNWKMAQWWTPFTLEKSKKVVNDSEISYITESRNITYNYKNHTLDFELNSDIEYELLYNGVRSKVSQPWTHLLIEQDFNEIIPLDKVEKVEIELEFTISEAKQFKKEQQRNDMHAAQLLWYLTIQNITEQEISYGAGNDYLWFGIPLFDSRFDSIAQSSNLDCGNEGSTNRLIYSMASDNYLKDKPLQLNKKYHFKLDVYPFVLQAIKYAYNNNALKYDDLKKYAINYMNFGWELPGNFIVKSSISKISINITRGD